MNKRKKIALYALIPILGLSLATSAFALENKAKASARTYFSAIGIEGDDQHFNAVVEAVLLQVKSQLASGKSIDDIINGKTIDTKALASQLKVKFEADMQARLAADVASGKITQKQADAMRAKIEKKENNAKERLAKALGMTKVDLDAAIESGKTIDQIITERGLDKTKIFENVQTKMESKMKGVKAKLHIVPTTTAQ